MSNADVSTLVRSSKRKLELITIDLLFLPKTAKVLPYQLFISRDVTRVAISKRYDLVEHDDLSDCQYEPGCIFLHCHKSDAEGEPCFKAMVP